MAATGRNCSNQPDGRWLIGGAGFLGIVVIGLVYAAAGLGPDSATACTDALRQEQCNRKKQESNIPEHRVEIIANAI